MLTIKDLRVNYGGIEAVKGISFEVPEKSIVTLIGANGAGKSTTLRSITGLVKASGGSIQFDGAELLGMDTPDIVAKGITLVPEGRRVFPDMTVIENIKMLAVARALMSHPKLMMMDEPSLGLAPLIVQDIFSIIKEINKQGVTILLIEQNANMALRIADQGYVLETGRIALTGTGRELLADESVKAAYLGKKKN